LVTRRTSPGFLSNNEAARERQRTQDFVRSLAGTNQPEKTTGIPGHVRANEGGSFVPNAKFWSSWKGRIVQAIVLSQAYNRDQLLKVTALSAEEYNLAFKELFELASSKKEEVMLLRCLFQSLLLGMLLH
jgi:hypothetical protein